MLILSQIANVVAGEQEDKITKLLMDMFNQPNNPLKINPIVVEKIDQEVAKRIYSERDSEYESRHREAFT